MKVFMGVIFGILFLIGISMYLAIAGDWDDSRAIHNFMSTKGKTRPPSSWDIGKGI